MHPFLLKIISTHMGKLTSGRTSLENMSNSHDEFLSAVREARSRLGRPGPEKTSSAMTRPDGSAAVQGKDRVAGKKDREGTVADLRDLTPLGVLFRESGISAERTKTFLDSLMAHAPDGKMPVEELLGRIRSMIMSEKGGDGRLLLQPGERLRVESALIKWGFSPKEADRALGLSSSGEGEVDVERFVRATLLHREQGAENLLREREGGPKPAGSWKADDSTRSSISGEKPGTSASFGPARGRATGNPLVSPEGKPVAGGEHIAPDGSDLTFKAEKRNSAPWMGSAGSALSRSKSAEKTTAKQASETNDKALQAEAGRKSGSLSVQGSPADGGDKEAHLDRVKGWGGTDGSPRTSKETPLEQGAAALQHRTANAAGPGLHQNWVKAAGTPGPPSSLPEHLVPAHVIGQVSKQISRAALSGDQTIRLQLNPPQLGALRVQMEWNQDNLRIEMITERHMVKEILLSSVAELKQALGEQGFRVDKMEVQVGDSSGRNLSPFNQERRDPDRTGARPGEEEFFFPGGEKASEGTQPFNALEGRLLDVTA